jgi:hypothetical protein
VKDVNVEKHCWEFDDVSFKPGECIEEVAMCISTMAKQLRLFGDDMLDKKVVKKMLQSVLEHLEQVAISMETLLDLYTLSIKEAAGHMQVEEITRRRRLHPLARMRAGGHYSLRSSGRHVPRLHLARSQEDEAMAVAVGTAGVMMTVVVVGHDLIHVKSGKTTIALMGRLRSAIFGVANWATSPGNADLRRK